MSIIESLSVSLFCIALVFFVLSTIFALINVLSIVLKAITGKRTKNQAAVCESVRIDEASGDKNENCFSTGELKLYNVDDKTAAIIMAIVSHESQTPLSELIFKSIKAVEE